MDKNEKIFYDEMMEIGVDALKFYNSSRTKVWKNDVESKALTRQGDLLARDIFVLINSRVESSPAGLVIAIIAIMQTFNFLMQSMPSGIYKGLADMLDTFCEFFGHDAWRWVKHDIVQYAYEDKFHGRKVDSKVLIEKYDNMLAWEDENYHKNFKK